MFRKILIANRGEIAVRILRTLQQMGIRTVSLYSDPDRHALHAMLADESYHLSGSTAAETYLKIDRIIDIAKRCGADAIHPGYGFLSENGRFAEACQQAGIVFIGPTPQAMEAVGDKIIAKQTVSKYGVPTVPGWSGDPNASIEVWKQEAKRVGYPILVKAAAGGGGKGMRRVDDESALEAAVAAAGREATNAFGDGRIFLERYVTHPRHVEFQILADHHGNIVHLFERECSIQRRHQKIIEESPSPALTPELRQRMGDAAIQVARSVNYTNAGTVEFMVDARGEFYFLEVNARLQVEHPVTEAVTGLDLVELQVRIAAGEALPFRQEDLKQTGHAFECRVYAEDASRGFIPSTGTIDVYAEPSGANIRVDSGVQSGSAISTYYDPMVAKVITYGTHREQARLKMTWALERFAVLGVTTNIEYMRAVLNHPAMVKGELHTHFLDEHNIQISEPEQDVEEALIAAAWAARSNTVMANQSADAEVAEATSPWAHGGAWRNV